MKKPIEAWLERETGLYQLRGNTYPKRAILGSLGAVWRSEGRYWLADKETAEAVGALFMLRVKIAAHCCMPEDIIIANHLEVASGFVRCGCPMCDTSYLCGDDVKILEVIGLVEV